MKVKFFADDFNDRRCWSWTDGEYVTDNSVEVEEFIYLGLRFEEIHDKPKKVKKQTKEDKKKQVASDKKVKEESAKLDAKMGKKKSLLKRLITNG